MTHHRLHIDVHTEDREWMKQHTEDIDHFVGLVIEMFEDEPKTLLSPVFRRLITDHARKVQAQRRKLAGREMLLDNPGKPITER